MKNRNTKGCNLVRQLRQGIYQLIEVMQLREFYSFCSRPKSRKGFRQYLTLILLFRVVAATYRAFVGLLRILPKLLEFTEPLFKLKLFELLKSIFDVLF